MISQSEQSALTLASNSGRSWASYLVVLVSGSSRAIFLSPPPELPPPPPPLSSVVWQAAASRVTAATRAASRAARRTCVLKDCPTWSTSCERAVGCGYPTRTTAVASSPVPAALEPDPAVAWVVGGPPNSAHGEHPGVSGQARKSGRPVRLDRRGPGPAPDRQGPPAGRPAGRGPAPRAAGAGRGQPLAALPPDRRSAGRRHGAGGRARRPPRLRRPRRRRLGQDGRRRPPRPGRGRGQPRRPHPHVPAPGRPGERVARLPHRLAVLARGRPGQGRPGGTGRPQGAEAPARGLLRNAEAAPPGPPVR